MRCILWSYNSNSEWIEWERELSMKNRNDWELWIVFPGDCSRLSISGKVRSKLMFVISNNESPAEGMGYLCHRKNSQKLWDFCLFMIKVQYRDCILLLYRMHRWPYRSSTSLKTLISDITWHHLTSLDITDTSDTTYCNKAISTFLNPSNLTSHDMSERGIRIVILCGALSENP